MLACLHLVQKTRATVPCRPAQVRIAAEKKSQISNVSFSIIKHPLQGARSSVRQFSSDFGDKPPKPSRQLFHMKTVGSSPNVSYGYPVPGPQNPSAQTIMNDKFFVAEQEWKYVTEHMKFDYVVVGSSFCALGFVEKMLTNNPHARILMLERGPFFLPDHFQNLPIPYQQTFGGFSETYPWTISKKTWDGTYINWLRGSIPFVGGRSLMWSGWSVRPRKGEMEGWPKKVIAAAHRQFDDAEKLLNVISVDDFEKGNQQLSKKRPVFDVLQTALMSLLKTDLKKVTSATHVMAAPLAVKAIEKYTDFIKFSTVSPLLKLIDRQQRLAVSGKGSKIHIATECVVQKVLQQNSRPTALETSRGIIPMGNSNLILAMGTLPATTLVLNSFPQVKNAGKTFTAHFISSIIARVPRKDFEFAEKLGELEIAAFYLAGCDSEKGQYHIQITALADRNPDENAANAARHMPDILATATLEQLKESKDHVVFVCAVLGEIKMGNKENWFHRNESSNDITTNCTLQVVQSRTDSLTWDTMEEGTFQALERILSPQGTSHVEYWHPELSGHGGRWIKGLRPHRDQIRVPALVHEGSTMPIGEDAHAVVDLNYRLKGVENVYMTGNSISPESGSWNPTLTVVALAQDLANQLSGVN